MDLLESVLLEVVPSSGVGTRRSSRRAPATDLRSDALRPADCPPNGFVADLSLEQLIEAVGMRAQSATLYQPPHAQSLLATPYQPPHAQSLLATPYQPQLTQSTNPCHHSRRPLASLQPPISLPTLHLHPPLSESFLFQYGA